MRLRPRGKREATRCPYCHDALGREGLLRCRACDAYYHNDCVEACVGLGCEGKLEPATLVKKAQASRYHLVFLVSAYIGLQILASVADSPGRSTLDRILFPIGLGLLTIGGLLFAIFGIRDFYRLCIVPMYHPPHRAALRSPTPPTAERPTPARAEARPTAPTARPAPPADLGGAPPSGLRPPRPPAMPDAASESPDPEDARLRQIETLRRRRQRPGLGKTI